MKTQDIRWIKGALQTAIAIENSTIPIYCAAMYSLEVQNYPAYNTLRSVVMEEMLHMAAAANMVAALGGRPQIKSLNAVDDLLNGLPGNVAPGLRARCARLSRRQLEAFMRIEAPEQLINDGHTIASGYYPTIGSFYEDIKQAIFDNADAVRQAAKGPLKANQVGGNLGYACIDPDSKIDVIDQFVNSIELIQDQGEGNGTTRSAGRDSEEELSHYARFAELRFGRKYIAPTNDTPPSEANQSPYVTESQRRYYTGDEVLWPVVINTLAVPTDRYSKVLELDSNRKTIEPALRRFDESYTRMMTALDYCWNGPVDDAWPSLGQAVYEMNELRVISCFDISRHKVPDSVIASLSDLYPDEFSELSLLTDLSKPVFYGPRFINNNAV